MGERFGNYEILRKLAAGGMAEVLLAKQKSFGGFERLVCLKRILPHLGGQEEFMKMFQDEARIAANLVHPNVAQIYDIAEENGQFYIAMEYVRGEDLRRIYNQEVGRGNSIPFGTAALVIMGAAAALDYAHRHSALDGTPLGIVHRDVSPQNILVTFDGHVKLIDFGVAKAAGKLNHTRAGVLKGKYSYMSPEQASGDPVDGRTDIFALGITLYEITCGVRLFKRDNELETLHAVVACNVPPPSKVKPGYDPGLERIVLKALAAEPERRYQTAGDLERDLEAYLQRHGHPTSASALAHYMQDLFAEKLADEALFGGQPWGEAATASRREKPKALATTSTPMEQRTTEPPRDTDEEATTIDQGPVLSTPEPASTILDHVVEGRPERMPRQSTPSEWRVRVPSEPTASTMAIDADQVQGSPHAAATTDNAREDMRDKRMAQLSPSSSPKSPSPTTSPARLLAGGAVVFVAMLIAATLWHVRNTAQDAPVDVSATAGGGIEEMKFDSPARSPSEAAPEPSPAPTPMPSPATAKETSPAFVKMGEGQAAIDVDAALPLAVTLGGHYLGETPLAGVPLPAGSYRFKLESKREGLVLWRRATLSRGQRARISVADQRTHVSIEAVPWAWVQRGLQPPVETPLTLDVLEGETAFVFECPDGRRTSFVMPSDGAHPATIRIDCALGRIAVTNP